MTVKSTVFLSYPSSLGETAARLALSLTGEGYSVFHDRSSLPAGESFDDRIRAAIEESDLLVFLITPDSVTPGRYTLTELRFAEQKWAHPAGHVLPVHVEPTPMDAIPAYLRAVTILKPRGNLVAEVVAEVARMTAPWWRRMLQPRRLVPIGVAAVLVAVAAWLALPSYLDRRREIADAAVLLEKSREQEQVAMETLRRTGLIYMRDSRSHYDDVLAKTLPVLSRGTADAKGERLANLLAHTGWAEYLQEGRTDFVWQDPARHYRAALEADPANVYAHTMWAFELLRKRGSAEVLAEAKRHFAAALETGREREYVRRLQISALLQTYTNVWIEDLERQQEALRVANAMRAGNEPKPAGWAPGALKPKLWAIYSFGAPEERERRALLAALPPAEHLATFRWLFPEEDLPADRGEFMLFEYLFVRAQVEEYGGDRAAALSSNRRLLEELAARKFDSSKAVKMAEEAKAAIRRLGT